MANNFAKGVSNLFGSVKNTTGRVVTQATHALDKAKDDFHIETKNESPAPGPSSARSNPFYVGENEKYTQFDKIRDRLTAAARTTAFYEIEKLIEPLLLKLTTVIDPKLVGSLGKTLVRLLPNKNELADIMLRIGPLPQNGWSMEQNAEGFARVAKHYSCHAESSILLEAPAVYQIAPVASTQTHFKTSVACLTLEASIDEIRRVSNLLFQESDRMITQTKGLMSFSSNDSISIVANSPDSFSNNVKISSGNVATNSGTVDIVAGDSISHHANSHKFTDGKGGTILIENGKIHFNPTIPAIAVKKTPDVIAFVEPVQPEGDVAAPAVKQTFAGLNVIGAHIT